MKQLNKIMLSLVIFISCLFVNSNYAFAAEILDCSNMYKNGSRGEQVKLLQKELNTVMSCKLDVDGIFGTKSTACVKKFQKKNSLTQDGIVGSKTCTKLNQIYNKKISKENEESKVEVVSTETKTLNVRSILQNDSKGEQVKLLQTELNKVMGCNLTVNGKFNTKTKTCVQNFQKKYGLTVDGVAGIATNSKLNILYLADINYVVVNVSADTNGGYLNVRAKATTSSTKLGTTGYGTIYQVLGSKKDSSGYTWYKIKFNGNNAYIRSDYTSKNAVVVDISDQTLKLYNNGKLTIDTPVITGTKGQHDTPPGRFTLSYKTSKDDYNGNPVHLSKYDAYVDYWMPFNGGIGFHDADRWRTINEYYNVNRYIENGSHGCINMLYDAAKTLYGHINNKTNIFVVA